jgi:hypothetical protein
VNRRQAFDGLELHEHAFVYDQVCSIPDINARAFVEEGNGALSFDRQRSLSEFPTKTLAVGRLEESRAEVTVHFHRCADNLSRKRIPLCPGWLWRYALGLIAGDVKCVSQVAR